MVGGGEPWHSHGLALWFMGLVLLRGTDMLAGATRHGTLRMEYGCDVGLFRMLIPQDSCSNNKYVDQSLITTARPCSLSKPS